MAKLINKAYDCPDWPTVPTGLAVLTIVFSEIKLFHYHHSKRFLSIECVASRNLLRLHAATELRILASSPGNQLEALRGDRKGQHSIRINDQGSMAHLLYLARGPLL